MLELTSLLLIGRSSEALGDFFGSNEQMNERVRPFFLAMRFCTSHHWIGTEEMGINCFGRPIQHSRGCREAFICGFAAAFVSFAGGPWLVSIVSCTFRFPGDYV